MSNAGHLDAPAMDGLSARLWTMVMDQAPPDDVARILLHDFDAASRVLDAAGYIQPNGFLTFKLGGQNGDNLLRLHFWPRHMPDTQASAGVHDHVFRFTSLVLAGDAAMVNTVYTIEQDAESPLSLFEVDYHNPRQSTINRLADRCRALATRREMIAPGQYYTLPAGAFHSSAIDGQAQAITLLASRLEPGFIKPRFLAASDAFRQPAYTRRDISAAQRQSVSACLAALKNNRPSPG